MSVKILKSLSFGVVLLLFFGCGQDEHQYQELFAGKLRIIDLTYSIDPYNAFPPGRAIFPFRLDTLTTISRDGFFSLGYQIPEHFGTHLDAPNHFLAGEPSVDHLKVNNFFASAVVIDIADKSSKNPDYQLRQEDIEIWEEVYRYIPEHALVFVYTGWGGRWGNAKEFFNYDKRGRMHFPGVSPGAARFLIKSRNIVGIGIDTPSIDSGQSMAFSTHKILSQAGKYVLENVANLDRMPARHAKIVIAPIKIAGGSGGQTRIFAILP